MYQTILSTASTPSTAYQVYCLAIVTKNRRVRVIARRDALGSAVTEFSPSDVNGFVLYCKSGIRLYLRCICSVYFYF